jgi:acyl-coenzyme A synthetase/AMP-(fatty) acid ligase
MERNIDSKVTIKLLFSALNQWESTGEPLTMETIQNFFDFFHDKTGNRNSILCNVYGGTEMMDNICDVFQNWDQAV